MKLSIIFTLTNSCKANTFISYNASKEVEQFQGLWVSGNIFYAIHLL